MTDHAGLSRPAEGLDDREADMYRLHVVNRWTQKRIAEKHGVSEQRVSQILADVRAKLPPLDLEGIRRASIELYESVQRQAHELAAMNGAPVTAGKDGDVVTDPESGTVVRDYTGRVTALKLALEADRELRKLLGADAASKVESSATVRYVLEGVSTDDLA